MVGYTGSSTREAEAVSQPATLMTLHSGPDAFCSVRAFRPFRQYLRENGVDLSDTVAELGLTDEDLEDADLRISHAKASTMLARAVEVTGEPALGVLAAECIRPGDFDVLEYAAQSSATMGESLDVTARYFGLLHDGVDIRTEVRGDCVALIYALQPGLEVVPASTEFTLASLVLTGMRHTGSRRGPVEVHFEHPLPANADVEIYHRVFRAPVKFDAGENAIILVQEAQEATHVGADSALREILRRHADQLLAQLPKRERFSQQVAELIAKELPGGNPGVDHIAKRLHMSARTLHRRLKEEGTTHRQMVDDVRRSLALRYLSEEDLAIGEISFLLGFSHVNAFHKAFKRWTDQTPAQYRNETKVRAIL